jgi:hypothetical protein
LLKETSTAPAGEFPALADPARYRLELSAKRANPWSKYSTDTFTTWVFSSSRPAEGQAEHPPLPQVDYDLALDDLNLAPDRSTYPLRINAGYVPGATGPGITSTQAWVSFTDGGTWRRVDLVDAGSGWLQGTVRHPPIENTTGAVSLRVRAADGAGNSVDQTLIRAYGLKPAT